MVVSQGICHETDLRLIWDGFDTVLIFVGERSKSGRTDVSWISAISHESRENRTFLRICVGFFSVVETSLMIHKTIIGDVSECSSLRDISATSDTTYTSIISTEEKNTIIIFNWECKLMFSFKTTELLMALDIKYAHSISFFAYISVLLCETRNVFVSDSNNSYANWIQNTKRVVHSGNWFRPESETFVRCHCAMSAITWNR